MSTRVTIYAGQPVPWAAAPAGWAQVLGFCRGGRVALAYPSAAGRLRREVRPIRRVALAHALSPLLPGFPHPLPDNFLGLDHVPQLCRRTVEVDPC